MTNIFNKKDIEMLIRQCVEGEQDIAALTVLHKSRKRFIELRSQFIKLHGVLSRIYYALETIPENELIAFRANYE